jgi:molybdopterin molybdotransferase
MTGAPVPPGADAVVMIERTRVSSAGVEIDGSVHPGENICAQGEDVRRGERVLAPGVVLDAPEIAVLASVGLGEVGVYAPPWVAVLNTGNELVEPGGTPPPGHIPNCNGPMLEALARSEFCEVDCLGITGDRHGDLLPALERGLGYDVLLVSGGVSMGDYDLVPEALGELGVEELFHQVLVKPGKPLFFGRRGGCLVFGVPGNPVSSFTTFHVFVKPALHRLRGIREVQAPVRARLTDRLVRRGERAWVVPASARLREGCLEVSPLQLNGSADIIGCAGCNALVVIDEEEGVLLPGAMVSTLLLNREV